MIVITDIVNFQYFDLNCVKTQKVYIVSDKVFFCF